MTALTDLRLWRGLGASPRSPSSHRLFFPPPSHPPGFNPHPVVTEHILYPNETTASSAQAPENPTLAPQKHHSRPFQPRRWPERSMSLGWSGSCDRVRARRDMDRWNDCRSLSDLAVVRSCCSPAPYECLTSIVRLFRYSNDGMLTLTMTHLRWNRDVDLRFFDNQMLYRSRSPSDG